MPHDSSEVIRNFFQSRLEEDQAGPPNTVLESCIGVLQRQIREASIDPANYLKLSRCYRARGDHRAALDTLRAGVVKVPSAGEIHYEFLRLLRKCGLDEEALAAGERACALVPDDFSLRLEYELYLPKLYDSEAEIRAYHRRFEEGLDRCIAQCDLGTRACALQAARGFSRYTYFSLAYQGLDDVALSRRYGEFIHRVMSTAYPQWSQCLTQGKLRVASRPVVGFVSAYFREHTVGRHFQGWLTEHDRDLYWLHCYHVGHEQAPFTEQYRRVSHSFFQSVDLEKVCEAIHRDQPDALIFTDVGMDPVTSQIAALRFAPVQCAAYGHPVTTGLPTIDYFISGELMEPPDAQQNYTETLLPLPNLGICFKKPVIPRALLTRSRADFGLPDEAVVYLCCQSVFKYLPQYDHLFAEIAVAVPRARFLFIVPNELLRQNFVLRLDRVFARFGLRAADVCHFLGDLKTFDYWNLNLVADIFLDTIAWSGGRSSLDAVACGLPVVTLRGKLMRQRQAAAILTLLCISETIAKDEAEYVAIAVRLGNEPLWRRDLSLKIESSHRKLFSDQSPILKLESFLTRNLRGCG